MNEYQQEIPLKGIKPAPNPDFIKKANATSTALNNEQPGGLVHQLAGDGVGRKVKGCTCFHLLTWIFQQGNSAELMHDVYPAVMAQEIPCPLHCVCTSAAKSRELGHRYAWEIKRGLPLFEEIK